MTFGQGGIFGTELGVLFIQLLVNGFVAAGVYAVVAVGLNIIFGVMEVINFAQGEFMMLGMYVGYFFLKYLGIPPFLAIIPVFVIFLILGFAIDLGIMERAWKQGQTSQLIITIGISTLMVNLMTFLFTANFRSVFVPYASEPVSFLGASLSVAQIIVILFSMFGLIALALFFSRTKLGIAIRAVSQDKDVAAIAGISKKRVYMFSFGLSMALTAAAGLTLLPLSNVYPTIGQAYLTIAFVVLVLGGMGSYTGAIAGSIVIGEVQSFSTFYLGGWSYVIVYVIFIVILVVRPNGLLGNRMRI
ncbi:MAG: branched-chain amino acid ABC transporter permease [Nitrososphaerota archaeon]|nr:branched-chain amino acid ABC transporter permease [Nitrososphaerota archaeon]